MKIAIRFCWDFVQEIFKYLYFVVFAIKPTSYYTWAITAGNCVRCIMETMFSKSFFSCGFRMWVRRSPFVLRPKTDLTPPDYGWLWSFSEIIIGLGNPNYSQGDLSCYHCNGHKSNTYCPVIKYRHLDIWRQTSWFINCKIIEKICYA
jgi:hypothetical protein